MGNERRKKQIEIDGLPVPWLAYVHLVKKRVFYHNPDTNQSLWELPPKAKKKCKADAHELEEKMLKILSSEESDGVEMMDCTEWEEPAGSPQDICEAMDIDFTEDLRQVRGSEYDKETLSVNFESLQPFADLSGTSRSCVVLDTCALIDEPDLIHSCISKNVTVVIPYRVFYELDRMKKLTSTSDSASELRRIATRVVWILRDLRDSPLIYWESSTESFSPVEGFMTSSEEDVNDDFILKCAFRIKALRGFSMIYFFHEVDLTR
ncbi:WW domain protein [Ancylostoma caninum]|uniref:WW domain protein n=2 Tax=Ancylostoma caninum TaxID=29170 RepID=A0A368FRL5_ANCCA|nr:WW domain protein [Ancylostoma caninum]